MNNHYWRNADRLRAHAEMWIRDMDIRCRDLTRKSIRNAKIIRPNETLTIPTEKKYKKAEYIEVIPDTTVGTLLNGCFISSIRCYTTALLNFASFKNPGGQFLQGSSAQEESLCHNSNLFCVLREFDSTYYAENRSNLNHGGYDNSILYTPNIYFETDHGFNEGICDVITCAAPNRRVMLRHNINELEINKIMKQRIHRVLEVAVYMDVDTLILGAFGCGVFKNDPEFVAKSFCKLLSEEFRGMFKCILFAVPQGVDQHYKIFNSVVSDYKSKM